MSLKTTKNYGFSLQTPLFLYVVFVPPVVCNTALISHCNNAGMFVSRIRNWEIWYKFGKRYCKPSFKGTLHPRIMHM